MSSEIETQPQPAPLADRIVQAARGGENVSAFHDEINNLTNEERLQLVRDLSRTGASSNDGQRRLLADGNVNRETGELVDLDLVEINAESGARTRHDLYTPGEAGEQYDRRQERQARTAPYEQLFQLLRSEDPDLSRQDAFFQAAEFFNKDFSSDPDHFGLYSVLKGHTMYSNSNKFEPVVPADSSAANQPDLANASPRVRAEISEIRRFLEHSSTQYGRTSW